MENYIMNVSDITYMSELIPPFLKIFFSFGGRAGLIRRRESKEKGGRYNLCRLFRLHKLSAH